MNRECVYSSASRRSKVHGTLSNSSHAPCSLMDDQSVEELVVDLNSVIGTNGGVAKAKQEDVGGETLSECGKWSSRDALCSGECAIDAVNERMKISESQYERCSNVQKADFCLPN